jgi:4-amino-4-deoxy-L-arabinose transferase-like glycosyltransferase
MSRSFSARLFNVDIVVIKGLLIYSERLNRSFATVYALLERPRAARRTVVGLLLVHSALLAYSAYVHSPTLNEPGHLVAGLSYWKFGRFDVYSVNPPLVKLVAALPVMAAGYEEDWSGFYTGLGARPEFSMGEDFVAANGERSFFLFMIARWACIPFSWLGGVICYLWARDLYGRPAGVIACAIWSFEPNILAHASLMTPDAHATSLGLAACYAFWRWLKHPTWTQTLVTGVVLGLAELAKTTFVLFYPLWPLLWLVYRWSDRKQMRLADWLREAGMLAARMAIGLYVLNLGYCFEGSMKPLGEYQFISQLFAGEQKGVSGQKSANLPPSKGRKQPSTVAGDDRAQGGSPGTARMGGISPTFDFRPPPSPPNRFANTWLARIPVPFPANYLIGIDLQQHDFEDYGRPSYLRGEWRDRGWWYYYLYAAAIKVPLGLWTLGALALLGLLARNSHGAGRDIFILLAPPLIVFTVVSSKTGFCEHFRYALPCFPFLFVWISGLFRNLFDKTIRESVICRGRSFSLANMPAVVFSLTLLIWFEASSLWIYPHSLSYFNESIGGPLNGTEHLLGSNVDWGQDLIYLEQLPKNRYYSSGRCYYFSWSGFRRWWEIKYTDRSTLASLLCQQSAVPALAQDPELACPSNLLCVTSINAYYANQHSSVTYDTEISRLYGRHLHEHTQLSEPLTYALWLAVDRAEQ